MASSQHHYKTALFALLILVGMAALIYYWRVGSETNPGDFQVKKGNYRLEDGQYDEAIREFSLALDKDPKHVYAHLGLAITYMQMERYDEAEAKFNKTIELAPEMAAAYADRGILYDRTEQYQLALSDYKKALTLDSEILEGPGFLWRFMRNVDKKPPGIAERAAYLETELQKPPAERLLNVPELDLEQRMYKVEE
jgi:tetratricopeptide (TPR) repeat protein